jgi:hypothetical protein
MGIHLSILDVQKEARQGQLGRPHIARLMIEKGIVKTIDEAFDTYLAKGRPAFVDKYRMDCRRVIEIIIGAGGIPVLAHPYLLRLNNSDTLENLLRILKTMGLKGLEVYYPEHPPEQVAIYEKLSRRYDLLMTGGTDYHGAIKPEIEMGSGKGDFHVPYMLYETLLNAC